MKTVFAFIGLMNLFFAIPGESLAKYWVVEEDFLKLGKKEMYEEEKRKNLGNSIVLEDLENPQYVFFIPVEKISYLEALPPLQEKDSIELSSCLHYKIFSLHQWLEKSSFRADGVFSATRPYCSYVLYDITPGSQKFFEEHLQKISSKQEPSSSHAWSVWKVVMGADTPKYLLCASFSTKEGMKEAHLEDLWDEPAIKDILRNKKSGWMKRSEAFIKNK